MTDRPTRPRWVTLLLVILPLWLVLSAAAAVWYFLHREETLAAEEQQRFVRNISAPDLADDLRKLVTLIGERNPSSEDSARNLRATAAMIEGVLGPSNTGYRVSRVQGPGGWPLIGVSLKGSLPDQDPLWLVTSYDSRPGSPGAEANASGLAATLAAAQALAGDPPERDVHFVFLPHANDPDSPILETLGTFASMTRNAGGADLIFCVEAMGAGKELWLSSRNTDALALAKLQGLGTVRGADVVCLGDDADVASILAEMNLPAVRVSTRPLVLPEETDNRLPDATTVAASAGRLVELIRRSAGFR